MRTRRYASSVRQAWHAYNSHITPNSTKSGVPTGEKKLHARKTVRMNEKRVAK